jgi:K+-transporting ATPase ATPase A chain
MTASAWGLLALFFAVLGVLAWPVGKFLAALCNERVPRWMQRVEAPLYKLAGTRPEQSMHWRAMRSRCWPSTPSAPSSSMRCSACRAVLPLNPAGMGRVERLGLQHRGELRQPTPTGRATPASRP